MTTILKFKTDLFLSHPFSLIPLSNLPLNHFIYFFLKIPQINLSFSIPTMLVQNVPKLTCELLPLTSISLKSRLSYMPSILFTSIIIMMHFLMYLQAQINPILITASRTDYFVQSYLSLFCLAISFFYTHYGYSCAFSCCYPQLKCHES